MDVDHWLAGLPNVERLSISSARFMQVFSQEGESTEFGRGGHDLQTTVLDCPQKLWLRYASPTTMHRITHLRFERGVPPGWERWSMFSRTNNVTVLLTGITGEYILQAMANLPKLKHLKFILPDMVSSKEQVIEHLKGLHHEVDNITRSSVPISFSCPCDIFEGLLNH